MKIGLYDPYLDTIGGGERYIATIAEYFSRWHRVEFLWDEKSIAKKIGEAFSLDLSQVKVVSNPFKQGYVSSWRQIRLSGYDRLFYLSDGSLPFSLAKKNILHFQFPVDWVKPDLKTKLKLSRFSPIICNSLFTKRHIDKTFHTNSIVLYPPVDIKKFLPGKKEYLILSVGRFTGQSQNSKKQHILIDTFKQLIDNYAKGWRLVLAGSLKEEDRQALESLKARAGHYDIEFKPNITFAELVDLYSRAAIYWHGAGFGVNPDLNPEQTEHFGISLVEAMASGCVVFAVANGGQTEIIKEGITGFTYLTMEELVAKTKRVIEEKMPVESIIGLARENCKNFSKEHFCLQLDRLFGM